VEREQNTVVHIKALTADKATVAGYGVIFGGADLEGESFGPETDFMLDLAPTKLVLYDHSLGEVKHVIGKTSLVEADDYGLWVEAELDRSKSYVNMVLRLVEQGALGWSSGSVGHLTRREGKSITQWPIVELSLTPTPAEPRTLGVELIKSLSAADPAYLSFLPEADSKTAVQGEEPEKPALHRQEIQEETPMAEVTEVVEETTQPDVNAMVKSAVAEAFAPVQEWLDKQPLKTADIAIPMVNKATKLGDDATKAYVHWLRTGDDGGIKHLKASNDTDLNIGTPADGGYAVPVGHYQGIIAKLRESALYPALGVRMIPGKGTTVNVPIEGARDGAFVATNEAATTDRDAPVLAQAPMTLVKYTKRIELSWELMEDEDSAIMSFLSSWVGEGMAATHNTLLVTEALAAGTLGAAWTGGATPISADDIPELVYALPSGYESGAAWVMRKAVEGNIRGKTGNNFQFVPTAPDGEGALSRRELFGYPLYNSAAMPALGASNKVALFGNFRYMGMRLAPDITFIRDPYSAAITGQLRLHYYFRTCYKILQSEAVLYAQQGT
jgi:HK97 family phage major capsid protein